MSKFTVFTLFPEQIENALSHSIMKRAMEDEKLSLNCVIFVILQRIPTGMWMMPPLGEEQEC